MDNPLFLLGGVVLGQIVLLEKCGNLVGAPEAMVDLAVASLAHCRKLNCERIFC